MKMRLEEISRPLASPFVITGYTFSDLHALWVTLEQDGYRGRGEGVGMYYLDETPRSMRQQLEALRGEIESGATRADIQGLLPPGGARNALDCAMWDWECKSQGTTIWEVLGIEPKPLMTVATVGIGTAKEMAEKALRFSPYPHLKIKLDRHDPVGRLRAIRDARPDATLVIDVNEGWTFDELVAYLPSLADLDVAFIEQPLPRGQDDALRSFSSPIPIGGDESCRDLSEYEDAAGKYDVINIKLDKCGGLTEALKLVERAKRDGKDLMVGNMTGTSLSMAPSHVIGQSCRFVDIDGPLLLAADIEPGLRYVPGGMVEPPTPELWG